MPTTVDLTTPERQFLERLLHSPSLQVGAPLARVLVGLQQKFPLPEEMRADELRIPAKPLED